MTGPPEIESPSPDMLGGVLREGLTEASSEARVDRYGPLKARALSMVAHLREDGAPEAAGLPALSRFKGLNASKLSAQIERCGGWLVFREYFTVGKVRLHRGEFCKRHLLCPFCAARRAAKFVKAYKDRFDYLVSKDPSLRPYLVTFTVKNGEDLGERYRHLESCFKRLMTRRRLARAGAARHASTLDGIEAGVCSFEVTNKGNGWHPHLHMLALTRGEPPQAAIRHEWERITGDSFMVDVRPIDTSEDAIGAFCEVFKYALKFSELSADLNLRAFVTLYGKTLLRSFGQFRGIADQVSDWLTDEGELDLDSLPFVEKLFSYFSGAYVLRARVQVDAPSAFPDGAAVASAS